MLVSAAYYIFLYLAQYWVQLGTYETGIDVLMSANSPWTLQICLTPLLFLFDEQDMRDIPSPTWLPVIRFFSLAATLRLKVRVPVYTMVSVVRWVVCHVA